MISSSSITGFGPSIIAVIDSSNIASNAFGTITPRQVVVASRNPCGNSSQYLFFLTSNISLGGRERLRDIARSDAE